MTPPTRPGGGPAGASRSHVRVMLSVGRSTDIEAMSLDEDPVDFDEHSFYEERRVDADYVHARSLERIALQRNVQRLLELFSVEAVGDGSPQHPWDCVRLADAVREAR